MKEILSIIFRRKKEAGIFAISMILIPMSIAYIVTPKYESSASFLLTPGRFKKPFLPNERDSQTGFVQLSMEDVASEVEMMLSRPVVEKVVAINRLDVFPEPGEGEIVKKIIYNILKGINQFLIMINLKANMPDFEIAVQKFINDVDIEYVKRTNIITVEWDGYSPQQAQNVINTFIQEYIKQHIRVHGNAQAFDVIKNEVDEYYQQLSDMEQNIEAVKTKQQSYDIDKERLLALDMFLQAKSRYESLLDVDENNLVGTNLGLYSDDPTMVELLNELVAAKVLALDLNSKYGKEDRKTITNQKKISELQAIIKSNHLKNIESWRERKIKYENRVSLLDKTKLQLDSMNRQLAGILDRYQTSLQKYNEALISNAMDVGNIASVRVVEYATVNTTPSFPKKILLLIISVFFAIFGGIATAFAAEKSYSRISTLKDLEESTGLPVLFSWPLFKEKEIKDENKLSQILNKKLISIKRFLGESQQDAKVHIVISPTPGVGSSFITKQMAKFAYNKTGQPTMLVSFNYLSISNHLPTNTVEQVEQDLGKYIEKTPDMDLLSINLTFGYILREKMIKHFIEKIKLLGYTNIFIDIPNERNDYNFISFLASIDHVYINIGCDLTDKHVLCRFLNVIKEQTKVAPVGCIFNMQKKVIPEFLYKRL